MSEIQGDILGFLEKSCRWVTTKEIIQEIYPNFKRIYADDTFKRLIRRELKKLVDYGWIWKHENQHRYHSSKFKLEEVKQIGDYLEHLDIIGNFTLSEILSLDPSKIPVVDPEAKAEKKRERALQYLEDAEPTQMYDAR